MTAWDWLIAIGSGIALGLLIDLANLGLNTMNNNNDEDFTGKRLGFITIICMGITAIVAIDAAWGNVPVYILAIVILAASVPASMWIEHVLSKRKEDRDGRN